METNDKAPEEIVEDIIGSFEVARSFHNKLEQHTKTEYGRLYSVAQWCIKLCNIPDQDEPTAQEMFDNVTTIGENKWFEKNFSDDPDAKKKNGSWKARTYLPKSYSSAKSVIRKGLGLGTVNEDAVIGKTELESLNREASKSPLAPFEVRIKKLQEYTASMVVALRQAEAAVTDGTITDESEKAQVYAAISAARMTLQTA